MVRYIDTGNRSANHALGSWLANEASGHVNHLRLQTGYFSLNGLAPIVPVLQNVSTRAASFSAVIGSNEADTLGTDLTQTCSLLGMPNPNVNLGVVSFSNGLFHPKLVHITRSDGSQTAYVGSANLTDAGVSGLNIEAGIILDTADGDAPQTLHEIAGRVDAWFAGGVPGFFSIKSNSDVAALVSGNILSSSTTRTRTVRAGSSASAGSALSRTSLQNLASFPAVPLTSATPAVSTMVGGAGPITAPASPAPSGAPATASDVLIAEIGGGDRWKQANFPISIMRNFFGVKPPASSNLELSAIDHSGAVESVVVTRTVSVQSQNYRMELGSVSGIPYPGNSDRPIGVFKRIGAGRFRYRVFFRADPGYGNLETFLARNYTGPLRQLKRIITDSHILSTIWPICPV